MVRRSLHYNRGPSRRVLVGGVLVLVLLSAFFFLIPGRLSQEVKALRGTLREMQGRQAALRHIFDAVGTRVNELSRLNALPQRDYAITFDKEKPEGDEDVNGIVLYRGLSFLLETRKQKKNQETFLAFTQNIVFREGIKRWGLTLEIGRGGKGTLRRGDQDVAMLTHLGHEGRFLITLFPKRQKKVAKVEECLAFLEANLSEAVAQHSAYQEAKSRVRALLQEEQIRGAIENDLFIIPPSSKGEEERWSIVTRDGTSSLSIGVDEATQDFLLGERRFATVSTLRKALEEKLKETSLHERRRRKDLFFVQEMGRIRREEAFRSLLEEAGLAPDLNEEEDDSAYYYHLVEQKGGEVVGSFAIKKGAGEVYIMNSEGVPVHSLGYLGPGHELIEEEPFPRREGTLASVSERENFLLVGINENNTDTIMLASFFKKGRALSLLSIPRDLYYRGRRINTIYKTHGVNRFVEELSSMLDLPIDNYMLIDMYAFIDVIDLLGGVIVTLDDDLIDPTYRVKNDDRWETLFYKRGTHLLDGRGALRVARSRYGSSDFMRAARQQKIMFAIKTKLEQLGLRDIGKLRTLLKILGKYIKTNLSTAKLIETFFAYRDLHEVQRSVMSVDNVLESAWSNLYRLSPDEREKALTDEHYIKGAFILLPKGRDWSILKSYVRDFLKL